MDLSEGQARARPFPARHYRRRACRASRTRECLSVDRPVAHQELTGERSLEVVDEDTCRLGCESDLTPNLSEAIVDGGWYCEQQNQCEDGERRRHPPTQPGGAKVSDKIGVIKNLCQSQHSSDRWSNGLHFSKGQGFEIGRSWWKRIKSASPTNCCRKPPHTRLPCAPLDHMTGDANKKNPQPSDREHPADRMGSISGLKLSRVFAMRLGRCENGSLERSGGTFSKSPLRPRQQRDRQSPGGPSPASVSIIAEATRVAAVGAAGVEDHISHLSTGAARRWNFSRERLSLGIQALEGDA
jgi:hypothetical protein